MQLIRTDSVESIVIQSSHIAISRVSRGFEKWCRSPLCFSYAALAFHAESIALILFDEYQIARVMKRPNNRVSAGSCWDSSFQGPWFDQKTR
jgi:hypothetical protein